ncbi:hypothetical protein Sango_1186600 [Sesamum angolense]|uniref:Uncharacterized protein n=1 Tax=Sesamum angolense TaxID=2727404 RepID=A0AAE2BX81_9LAMI|nr:hypothetical protein Sango_1186600 [Sesamum angolense]
MGNRRFAQALTSDDEDDAPQRRRDSNGDENLKQRKRKMVHFPDEDDEEKEMEEAELTERKKKKKKKKEKEEPEPESEAASENEEQGDVEAQPMGTVVRVSGRGRGRRNHYESFEYNGHQYWLGNCWNINSLLRFYDCPTDVTSLNSLVYGEDIAKTWQGELMVTGQWFYRPEEAEKRDGGNWPLCDTRELFYSFHRDEVPAESVFHNSFEEKETFKEKEHDTLDDSREDEGLSRSQSLKPETTGNTAASSSEYYAILSNFKQLTGETQRDKWLEKLLQCIKFICTPVGNKQNNEEDRIGSDDDVSFDWPDAAVPAIAALEKAAHDALSADFQKYNQKMRQLAFNLKSNAALARRLLNRELEPAQILNMSPNELKEGLTAEEIASRKPEESGRLQMTDARCTRCMEKQVGLLDIIRLDMEIAISWNVLPVVTTWYASRDDAAALTIEGPSSAKTVGTAPLATAKFEDVQKSLMSSGGGAESGSTDVLKKTTEAYVPVMDDEKSCNKTVTEENPTEGNAM